MKGSTASINRINRISGSNFEKDSIELIPRGTVLNRYQRRQLKKQGKIK